MKKKKDLKEQMHGELLKNWECKKVFWVIFQEIEFFNNNSINKDKKWIKYYKNLEIYLVFQTKKRINKECYKIKIYNNSLKIKIK